MTSPDTVVLLSGGLDSAVLLGYLQHHTHACATLSVDYGSRHADAELVAAAAVATHYGVSHKIANLRPLTGLFAPNSLTDTVAVPHGHYTDESMRATVVPGRNLLMLSVATAYAASIGATAVAIAVHAGDHPIYPDCRPEFIHAATHAALLGTAGVGDVVVRAPFVALDKTALVAIGAQLDVPFDLTWSCYEGDPDGTGEHCGKCGTCVERAEAFALANVVDPTTYARAAYVPPRSPA